MVRFEKKEINFLPSDYTITGFGWAEVRSCPRLTQGAAAGHHIIYYYYTTHTFLTWVEILFSIGSYLVEDFFWFQSFFLPAASLLLLLFSKRALSAITEYIHSEKKISHFSYILLLFLQICTKNWRDYCHLLRRLTEFLPPICIQASAAAARRRSSNITI